MEGLFMDKLLKNIIDKTIEREYDRVSENLIDNLKRVPKLFTEYSEAGSKMANVLHELQEILPDEYKSIVDEIDVTSSSFTGLEARFMFRMGVLIGLTELNYLNEVGLELSFI